MGPTRETVWRDGKKVLMSYWVIEAVIQRAVTFQDLLDTNVLKRF